MLMAYLEWLAILSYTSTIQINSCEHGLSGTSGSVTMLMDRYRDHIDGTKWPPPGY